MKNFIKYLLLTMTFILVLTACNDYNEPDETAIITPSSSGKIGEIISFGGMEWRVLDEQDGKLLLITENIIEHRAFNDKYVFITWEHSSARHYLNNSFYNDTFTSEEKNKIADTEVINVSNPVYGTTSGNNTTDKIFLLSFNEAEGYFKDDNARLAYNLDGRVSWWLLRTAGYTGYDVMGVNRSGKILIGGYNASNSKNGIRPAMWVAGAKI